MTFQSLEISRASGQPVELYDFALADEQFNYTSSEETIQIGAVTYEPVEIERSSIRLGTESRQDVLTVRMPSRLAPANRYVGIVPGQRGTLTIKRQHRNDGATPETIVIFKGVIRSVGYVDDGYNAELAVVPLTAGLSREVPRFTYQGLCNHVLYDSRCKVPQGDFSHTGRVLAVNGNVVTVDGADGQANGFYAGGFAQLGTNDFRLILEHTGTNLTLLLPFPNNVQGRDLTIFAGCDHTLATCKSKFNNVVNYGGFAFVPLRNIFESGIV